MKRTSLTPRFSLLIPILLLFSCVPSNKFQEVKEKKEECEENLADLKTKSKDLETRNNELSAQIEEMKKQQKALERDTTVLGESLRKMRRQYDKINDLNDELLRKHAALKEGEERENEKLLSELEKTREELQKKEDDLRELEQQLEKKKKNLEELEEELKKREKRVQQLENIIARKDSAVSAIRDKVKEALLSFKDEKGLQVEQRNGKIYVSLEAKLLFASGSTKIDGKGRQALVDLAKAFEEEKDLHILVEGHTDADKVQPNPRFKDNWDLSVLRATSVVKIMVENSEINPQRLTAAGRSKYLPVDEDDKAKNRRIEVILTPNLDKLFAIINSTEVK